MSDLMVRFWGTRGSIPTPGRQTEKYGGNTTCLELRYEDTIVVIDAGSGIRQMSNAWARETADGAVRATLLFTHLHWDHIQGFPFFTAAYVPGNEFVIYGEERATGSIETLLGVQMSGDYFPIPLAAMKSNLTFRSTTERFEIGPLSVRTFRLPHPGGSLAFRIEVDDTTFILATDCELDQWAINREALHSNHYLPREYEPELIEFMSGANMLVIDSQYTDDQYRKCRGWGHNSTTTVVDLCTQVSPDMMVLCHHDPRSTDDDVAMMVSETSARLQHLNFKETMVFAAREGMTLKVQKPKRAPELPD